MLHDASLAGDDAPIRPAYPGPTATRVLTAADKKDQLKLAGALAQLVEEDATLQLATDPATQEHTLRGMGELHLALVVEHLASRYHLAVK